MKTLPGVVITEVGCANGIHQTLDQLYDGYAECVKTTFGPDLVTVAQLLEDFFTIIDPYSVDKQGIDVSHKYRTGVYSVSPLHLTAAHNFIQGREDWEKVIVEVLPLTNYVASASEHQDHLERCPGDYCYIPPQLLNKYKT